MLKNLSGVFGLIIILLTIYHDLTVKKELGDMKARQG
ncbi:hypothetical protein SAMN05216238_10535 [Lentibacillus persicus]|uniref:Uncharacterized protein n=1 Tax=Lentibacillus persicus TaxID=640948 RepID=A0A1I1W1G2_9BACI|nr:hypothetical protein SAMN05216238_10535 [Lentibacillus persicus]